MTKFTLKRGGQFEIRTSGPNHCGTKDPLKIKYTLICECGGDSLDDRGFLFDQMKVKQYFDTLSHNSNVKPVMDSCEQFAVLASRQLFRIVKKENSKCEIGRLALTLSPEPFEAELTFEWEPNGDVTENKPEVVEAKPDVRIPALAYNKQAALSKKKAKYKGREYDVLSHNKKTNVYRLAFSDGSKSFYAKGGLVTPLDEKLDGYSDGVVDSGYKVDYDNDAEEFGYEQDTWFDMVNGMDEGEYERFKTRLRNDRKTKNNPMAPVQKKSDLSDVTEAF